jgi:hypothetical protein
MFTISSLFVRPLSSTQNFLKPQSPSQTKPQASLPMDVFVPSAIQPRQGKLDVPFVTRLSLPTTVKEKASWNALGILLASSHIKHQGNICFTSVEQNQILHLCQLFKIGENHIKKIKNASKADTYLVTLTKDAAIHFDNGTKSKNIRQSPSLLSEQLEQCRQLISNPEDYPELEKERKWLIEGLLIKALKVESEQKGELLPQQVKRLRLSKVDKRFFNTHQSVFRDSAPLQKLHDRS